MRLRSIRPCTQANSVGFTVYKITNLVTGMVYIGSTMKPLPRRWNGHCNAIHDKTMAGKPLYQDMAKYGIEHFAIEPLSSCGSKFEMLEQEAQFTMQYNSLWPNGYNLTIGRIRANRRRFRKIMEG